MSKTLKYVISGIIILLVLIYLGGSIYAKHQATKQVNTLIAAVESQYSNTVHKVSYQSVDANFFSLFNDDLDVNGIVIDFTNQANNPLHIARLGISHYQQNAQGVPTRFSLRLYQVQFSSFKQALINVVNDNQVASYLSLLPISINPYISLSAVYSAEAQSLDLRYSIHNGEQSIINTQQILKNFVIEAPFSNLGPSLLKALDKATVQSDTTHINYTLDLNQTALQANHGHIAQVLKDLGYTSTNLTISGSSVYSAQTKLSQSNMRIALANGGVITQNASLVHTQGQTYHELSAWLQNPSASQSTHTLLQSYVVQYTDQSLVDRIYKAISQNSGQSVSDLKLLANQQLEQAANNTHIPQFKNALLQLKSFINQPGSLTLSIQPAKPYNLDAANQFINQRIEGDEAYNKQLKATDPAARAPLEQAHARQTNADLSKFLNELGFNVTATPPLAQ